MKDKVSFRKRDLKGSRLRCLMLTGLAASEIVAFLDGLVQPYASVGHDDIWCPRGFLDPNETRLDIAQQFLVPKHREALVSWWLAVRDGANTPNWDLVSTCQVQGGRVNRCVNESGGDLPLLV